ncbi:MAG: protein phosphatase 2C domain-containing protein [Nocardioidaceae bacterium]|nr:protein phosphatase 2C domain-containing protein [Nocardioidaceae bacterium]MCL2614281.1 protein phosphatase 2C domain-containing protein [Nocardioidaceae bacterium]
MSDDRPDRGRPADPTVETATQPPVPPPPGPADRPTDPTVETSRPATEPTAVHPTVAADTEPEPAEDHPELTMQFHAVSDVGRVRKDNQDSGYAGPWLLAVCDGVGGAARGDIASSSAVNELRHLDLPPAEAEPVSDLIVRITDGLHEAHESIGSQVDHDPALNGTSTTVVVGLFDGERMGFGHVGDSRAYLLREGRLSQLTTDHTFVQSLIDEGRMTEEEARVHPHRNLILKALDGLHDVEPDLFQLEVEPGDRFFLCSDGACGVLDNDRIAQLLSDGSPEFAAIELVRASLDAGSSDNVTCVVADVVPVEQVQTHVEPMTVGAAAELRRRLPRALFRGHRSGDTGELEPVEAELAPIPPEYPNAIRADPPFDPEAYRYAPRAPRRFSWTRRLMALLVVLGLVWIALASAYWWTQRQYYVGDHDGHVAIFRGVHGVPGLSSVYQDTDLAVGDLPPTARDNVEDGKSAGTLQTARDVVQHFASIATPGGGH